MDPWMEEVVAKLNFLKRVYDGNCSSYQAKKNVFREWNELYNLHQERLTQTPLYIVIV